MEDIDVGMPDSTASLSREEDEEIDGMAKEDEGDSDRGPKKKKKGNKRGGVTLSGLLNAIVSRCSYRRYQ